MNKSQLEQHKTTEEKANFIIQRYNDGPQKPRPETQILIARILQLEAKVEMIEEWIRYDGH